jgi:alpha-galactosidase
LEIDYQTSGPRSLFMSVNGATAMELDLNGDTFSDPTSIVVQVNLHAGSNAIEFGNPSGYAPDLDRIVVAPEI